MATPSATFTTFSSLAFLLGLERTFHRSFLSLFTFLSLLGHNPVEVGQATHGWNFFIWAVGVLGGESGVIFGAGGKYLVTKTEQNMLDASSVVASTFVVYVL